MFPCTGLLIRGKCPNCCYLQRWGLLACDSPVLWHLWAAGREVVVLRPTGTGESRCLLRLGRCWDRYSADEYVGNCLTWELGRVIPSLEVRLYF